MSLRTMHFVSVYYIAQTQLVGTVAAFGVAVDGAADGRYLL